MERYIKKTKRPIQFKPTYGAYKDVVLNNSTSYPYAVDSYYETNNQVIKKYISNFVSLLMKFYIMKFANYILM